MMNLQFFGIYRFKEWCKFQFIVLLFITQIAWNSNGLAAEPGRDVKVGKLRTATSKRTVPLNEAAIRAIEDIYTPRGISGQIHRL